MKVKQRQQIALMLIFVLALIVLLFPLYIGMVGSTHSILRLQKSPLPVFFGTALLDNLKTLLEQSQRLTGTAFWRMFNNSLLLGTAVAVGKIITAMLAAYALVFFQFPLRRLSFWLILLTLMLPVETRIFSTYEIMSQLRLTDSYAGLILPLIGSATATFFFRQYFIGIPTELCEAAQMDGIGPMQFLWEILVPLSKTAIACVFVLMFIFGWNQYLWPILVTNDPSFYTLFLGIRKLLSVEGQAVPWNIILLVSVLAILPPVLVLFALQKSFIEFLLDQEK